MGIIYCYTNQINNKKYIGQTINPEQRKKAHKSDAFNPNSPDYNSVFHAAVRKYGWENFKYEILLECDNSLLNEAEIFYIKLHKSLIGEHGYNVAAGGAKGSYAMSEEAKEKLRWVHGKLTKDQVINLRLAYAAGESPTKIYKELYADQMHYNSFLNIWCGKRYASVMPEVINTGRHTKLTEEQVYMIKRERLEKKTSYQKLGEKYGVTRGAIESICKGKTWVHVQLEEPVSTIPESGEQDDY